VFPCAWVGAIWVEGGADEGSVVYFCAVSTLEASLLFILETTAGCKVLFNL
jgi:hypothetical protein